MTHHSPVTHDAQGHQEAPQAEVQAQMSEDPLPNLDDNEAVAEPSHSWEIDPETGKIIYQDVMMEGDGNNGLDDEPECKADQGEDEWGYEVFFYYPHLANMPGQFASTAGLKLTPFDSIQKPQSPPKPQTPLWDSHGAF
ncbi:hypothetical protein PAXRUDRAFT_16266 [Paxillus rubicundulus Ve08.2h10]|uniref:Uncharacterized protein n=1 Tax=Paxillus rubicundulus Ve08.2h10 TaxID=930991 RepID=A0A0D0DF14_9AGAM|nr:hypothetical protein PAXRUDRAFT_16266 [Paxillus rubicundulus Ve08.2h10]